VEKKENATLETTAATIALSLRVLFSPVCFAFDSCLQKLKKGKVKCGFVVWLLFPEQ